MNSSPRSLTGSLPTGERRSLDRLGLRLPCEARSENGSHRMLVRNLSSEGFLAEMDEAHLQLGHVLHCEFPNDVYAEGRIVWVAQGLVGAEFTIPLASSSMSAALLKGDAVQDQYLRASEIASASAPDHEHETSSPVPVRARILIYLLLCLSSWLTLWLAWQQLS